MASGEEGRGSWHQQPDNVGITESTTANIAVSVANTSDDAHDIEEGVCASQEELSASSSSPLSPTSRPTVRECLNVPEEEMADLPLDVYSMFFLSDMKSQGFFYSIFIFIIKMALYLLIMIDLFLNKQFPSQRRVEASQIVKATQLFLMPVAILMQEELITSFFIISRLKYSPGIRRRNPGAHKWKFFVAHAARLLDGFIFLFINVSVMLLQVDDVLALFLNFAALQFLQTVDNMAISVCLDGYWTRSLQDLAKDVNEMKFAYRHHHLHYCMQTSFVAVVWIGFLSLWSDVHLRTKEIVEGGP